MQEVGTPVAGRRPPTFCPPLTAAFDSDYLNAPSGTPEGIVSEGAEPSGSAPA